MAPMESPQTISTVKLPMLKKGEYTLWSISMEQYLTNTDYSLWQLIMNGDEPVQTTKDENGIETEFIYPLVFVYGRSIATKRFAKKLVVRSSNTKDVVAHDGTPSHLDLASF
ncbi:hypothetical protein Tco_1532566 [Tanacetum coccineum]